jgi:ATP-dependent DNA helicase
MQEAVALKPGLSKPGDEGRDPRQPALVTGAVMRKYQVEGVLWMASLYENGLNGILADEMGLGKTLQTIAFISHLFEMKVYGPFLVVAPLSTIQNWSREFSRFSPSIPTLVYHGSKEDRKDMRDKIADKKGQEWPVVITSFEVAMNDAKILSRLPKGGSWKYLVVDEGHRLKNKDCRLLRELKALPTDNRLLLSGTPLQVENSFCDQYFDPI